MNGIPLRYRLLSVCAATLLSGCGGASIDLLPPPDSAPVEGETAAESRLPAAPAVPRASDIAWQEASGPIFDWRAEIAPAAVGDHGRQGLTPPAAAETGSATSAAAAAGAMALEPAGQGPLPGVVSPPPAVAAELPWQGVAGPIFDWGTRSPATAGETASAGELQPWQRREQRLHRLPGWRLSGRVAITAPEESWSAVVRWEQVGDAFHVRLSNPLGQGLADLRGTPGDAFLVTAEGAVYRAPDAETLLRDVTGVRLPVSGLRYWVLAVSDPHIAKADVALDSDSLPESLQQAGWRVEYDRYRDSGDERLPDRLSFQGADMRGRLIITDWQVDGS